MNEPSRRDDDLISRQHFRSLRLWLGGLLAILAGAGFAVANLSRFDWPYSVDRYFEIGLPSIWYSPVGFAVGWLVFGNDSFTVRSGFAASKLALLLLCASNVSEFPASCMLLFIPGYALLLGLTLLGVRVLFLRLETSTIALSHQATHRFSISDMLWLTSLTAVVLAVVRMRLDNYKSIAEDQNLQNELLPITAIFIGLTSFASLFEWIVVLFFSARFSFLFIAMLTIALAVSLGALFSMLNDFEQMAQVFIFFGLSNLLTFALLQILRAHGYHYVWRWSKPAQSETAGQQ